MSKLLIFALTLACLLPARAAPDYDAMMAGRDGCVLVYDLQEGRTVTRWNPARCALRVPPCSTFKVAVAVMAFDRGLLKGPQTAFKWDGTDGGREEVNRDQTAASWLSVSVVWVTQQLTKRLGMATVKRYLRAFDYGNQNLSGGLTRAWLVSSLLISPDEQSVFMRNLWRERLRGASKAAQRATVALLPRLALADGGTMAGKTGSGVLADGRDLGWYAGYILEPNGHARVIIVSFTDRTRGLTKGPAGYVARAMALRIATAARARKSTEPTEPAENP